MSDDFRGSFTQTTPLKHREQKTQQSKTISNSNSEMMEVKQLRSD